MFESFSIERIERIGHRTYQVIYQIASHSRGDFFVWLQPSPRWWIGAAFVKTLFLRRAVCTVLSERDSPSKQRSGAEGVENLNAGVGSPFTRFES